MSLAVQLDNHNKVISCIEIPDEEDDNAIGFIKYVLKIPGNWLSAAPYQKRLGINPTVGSIYIPEKDLFIHDGRPFDDWILDENYIWVPPVKNNLRNMNFGYDNEISKGSMFFWNQEKHKWGHGGVVENILNEKNRNNGIYFISKAMLNQEFSNASDYVYGMDVVCLPKSYKYVDVHPDWQPGFVYPIFRETFGKKYGVTQDNDDKFLCHENYIVPFDGVPYFFIHYANLCDLTKKENILGIICMLEIIYMKYQLILKMNILSNILI